MQYMKKVFAKSAGAAPKIPGRAAVAWLRASRSSLHPPGKLTSTPPLKAGFTRTLLFEQPSTCVFRQAASVKTSWIRLLRDLDTWLLPHVIRTTTTLMSPERDRCLSRCLVSPKTTSDGSSITASWSTTVSPGAKKVVSPLTASEKSTSGGASTKASPSTGSS